MIDAATVERYGFPGHLQSVPDEIDATALPVTGALPPELHGRYVRNGPNALPGETSAYFQNGPGMLHGVRLLDGRAEWYRNRWVRTAAFEGRPFVTQDGRLDRSAVSANTHVIGHARRMFALVEAGLPYEVTPELDTVGPCDFGGRLTTAMTAHPKRDPATGDLHFFGYGMRPPYLTYHRLDKDGRLTFSREVPVPAGTMTHDFAITEHHALWLDLPVTFQPQRLGSGLPYGWDEAYGARLGLMRRDVPDAPVRWFDIEPCFVFHVGNAHERPDGRVVLDAVRYSPAEFTSLWEVLTRSAPLTGPGARPGQARLHRWTLDPASGTVAEETLDEQEVEFPTLDDERVGRPARYLYVWAGQPYKTQDLVARARRELFKPTPDGLTGNDDLGTMGAWYVWSSMGIYPAIPGRSELIVNSPAFEQITVTRSNGKTLTVNAPGASETNRYVQALKVNGTASTRAWLPEGFAGRLDFTLGAQPDTGFGATDPPPSFQAGMRPYLVSLDPGATAVEPGGTVTTTLTVQAIGEGGALTWAAEPPAGITVTPDGGTVDVPGNGQAKVQVTLAVGAGMATGFATVPVEVAGVSAAVKLNVAARGTIEWHQNNAGIGDDTEAGLANFDGIGWSYSAQALAAAGARPGGTVTWKGHTFAWPGREPGEWDNVQAGGQTVDLTAPAGAKTLALLGAGASGDIETNLTVTYTDGSTQETKVGFSDWALGRDAYQPRFGNEIVLRTPYRLDGGGGRQEINVYVFAAAPIQLDASKQVKSLTPAKPTGSATAHIFAWSFGG